LEFRRVLFRSQPPQCAIGPPLLGQFSGRPGHVARIIAKLGFKPLKQRECIGGAAGEAGNHLPIEQAANLGGVGLHDGTAHRHLAVASNGYATSVPHRKNRGHGCSTWAVFSDAIRWHWCVPLALPAQTGVVCATGFVWVALALSVRTCIETGTRFVVRTADPTGYPAYC